MRERSSCQAQAPRAVPAPSAPIAIGDHRPAEQPEPAVEQAPGQSEHCSGAEQEHRAVVDRAFDRCGEQQDRRRLAIDGAVDCGRASRPSRDALRPRCGATRRARRARDPPSPRRAVRQARVRRRVSPLGNDLPGGSPRGTAGSHRPGRGQPGQGGDPGARSALGGGCGRPAAADPRADPAPRPGRASARCRADTRDVLRARGRAPGAPRGSSRSHAPRRPRRRLLAARARLAEGRLGPGATRSASHTAPTRASGSSRSGATSSHRRARRHVRRGPGACT